MTGKDRRKIKEAINLIDRINKDLYLIDQINFDLKFTDGAEGPLRGCIVRHKKRFDLPTYELARKYDKKSVEFSRLCSLLEKHLLTWWD